MHVRKKTHVNMVANLACMFDTPTYMLKFLHVENFLHVASFLAYCKFLHVTDVNMHVGVSTYDNVDMCEHA